MKKSPIISVVVPVYNVESYLQESIGSIIGQTIGFEENIELILVDDGSTDNSSQICIDYQKQFPQNIQYIKQKNQGVSAARNTGLKQATGKYINFLDSDDIWSKDAFKNAVNFMEENGEHVDFVATKIKFFGKTIDQHPSNYKFIQTRVINLSEEPDNPIFHLPTCVFKKDAIAEFKFDTRLKMTEDAKFLSEVLKRKQAYGVLAVSAYNYRKRHDETSAIGGQISNRDFYLTVPELAYKYMMDSWRDDSGHISEFMQYEILSDLAWRINQPSQSILNEDEEKAYKATIKQIVSDLDDEVILAKRGLVPEYKAFLLQMKHGSSYKSKLKYKKGAYYFSGHLLARVAGAAKFHVDFLHHTGYDTFKIEGYVSEDSIKLGGSYYIETSQGTHQLSPVARVQRQRTFLGEMIDDGGAYEATFSLNEASKKDYISIVFTDGTEKIHIPIETNQFSGFSGFPKSYRKQEERLLRKEDGQIKAYPYARNTLVRFEARFIARILLNIKLRAAWNQVKLLRQRNTTFLSPRARLFELSKPFLILAESIVMIPRSLTLRLLHHAALPFKQQEIWLISDRGMAAGDNGEALFRFLQDRGGVKARAYYVISKKSPDYKRMKQYGRVLNQDGFKYKLLFLLADKIISSQADTEITNPFFRQIDHVVDLFKFDFVFLQHGIIRHDLSAWLNRFNKNISIFVTSAQMEYDSIMNHPYYYEKKNVVLTGLPRFDLLSSNPKGKLILAPTYRKNLVRNRTDKNGARAYDPAFKQSSYYKFYSSLMNDERIKKVLQVHKMVGELYLHPALAAQTVDFNSTQHFMVKDFPYSYKTAFEEGALMVSDYSSVVFDFAYLKKPIIYAHYDADTFYQSQLYDKSHFFSDAKDGFGRVVDSYESLVKEIVHTINNGCTMEKKYIKRVDSFFDHNDRNNSLRVYNAIKGHQREGV